MERIDARTKQGLSSHDVMRMRCVQAAAEEVLWNEEACKSELVNS